MKTVQLASAGQKHLVSTYKQPKAWGDDHVNNAWSLTDALPELQCLAVKALAVAINQGDLIDTFLDGIPVSWDKSRLDVYKISNPNQLSLYDVSNATRKRLLMRTFGSVNNKTDIVIRPNGKGYSFSFSFNHEDLSPKDNVGLTLASITECFRRLLNYGDIPSAGSFYSSPEQLDKAMLMYDWLQRRFPKGKTTVVRIPLENLLPDEFTEMDEDGENAYYLSNFREASANLKVEIFNPQTDTSEIVFSEYNTPPAIKEKYAEAFANTRYPKITLTEKEILALRDTTTLSFVNNAFFGLRTRVSIEVDLDKDETDFITQGTQDVVDMADWLSAAVQVAGTEEQPNYCYGTVDLSSGVKPRTGLAQTMISPYNLTPIYIPKGVGISAYRERVREHYVGKDGYRRFNDKDSISLPNCVIGVDWLSNRMLYSQGNNRMTSLDLSDFAITKPYHITRYADNRIFSSDNAMGVSLNRIYEIVVARNLGMSEKTKEALMSLFVYADNYRNLKLSNLWDTYLDYAMQKSGINGLNLPVFQNAEVRADLEDLGRLKALSTDNPLPFVQAICMVLDDFWETFAKDEGRMYFEDAGYSLTSLLQLVGFASVWRECYRTDKQAMDFNKLADSLVNERQPDEYSQLPENYEPRPVPNLRDGVALLPHQAKVTSSLELGKQHNLLEVSAGGGKCLTGNALVPTSMGLMTVKELFEQSSGDGTERAADFTVETKQGYKQATGTYTTKGKTHRVLLSNGSRIEGLPEHRLWALKDGSLQFIRLDELTVGTALPRYAHTELFGTNTSLAHVSFETTKKADTEFVKRGFKYPDEMTPELAELLGWIVAEGCGSLGNTISQHNRKNCERIVSLIESVFGNGSSRYNKEQNLICYSSKNIGLFLSAIVGTGLSAHRYMPKEIRTAPRHMVAAFLSALWEGDGTVYLFNKGSTDNPKFGGYTVEYTTISKELAQQILVMMENFGIECCVHQSETYQSQGGIARVFTVSVNRASHAKFQQEIGFISKEKRKLLKKAVQYRQSVKGSNNDQVFGVENKVPVGNEVNRLFKDLEQALQGIKFYTNYSNRWGSTTRIPKNAKLAHLHSLAKTNGQVCGLGAGTRYLYGINDNGWTNTWTVQRLLDCYKYLPRDAHSALPDDFKQRLSFVKEMTNHSWVRVSMSKPSGKKKQVYDICVEDVHEYSVQTIMSHNTILVITDVLRKLKEGKTKVPAVFCPGHLLANYVQDANYITDGKVNVIPLRTETYNRLGAEYFEKVAQSKPINTFFVIDYGFASQEYDVAYVGTETVGYYPRAEWLRSLGIDYVWLDESHMLKNYSARTLAMREALIDVKGVTLATGTFYPTRASDIINQSALWDTGLFGYAETFESSFGVENGIMNEAARAHVNNVLTKNVVVARAKRKEWAATLPDRTVAFHFVSLSKRARDVYEAILKATLDEIKKDPVIMKLLAKSAENDEADEAELGDRLQQYLQRLEMSITCPYQDDLWQKEWGIDSPKLKTLEKICRDHINQNIPGKILIFCSYNSSVNAIYDNLSPDLKAITLRYSAATKEKDRAKFEKDDNIKIMIGIENSMNTGINAQFASRLIRVDSIYSPGQLEQGESRIARPNLKVQEFRDHLYFDWILAERSYDATKTARLVSKILNVEKFNNMYEPAYQKMKDLPVLRLNFDVIANSSDFDNELSEYLKEYIELENHIKVREVQDFRKRNPHLTPVPLKSDGLLKGSALMKHVPYIPLGGLPSVIKEDLRPINEVLMDEPDRDLKGGYVHTEYGEGIIRRVSKNTVQVEVPNAGRISLPINTVYLIDNGIVTRSTKSIREQLARFNKLKGVSLADEAEDVIVNDTPETGFEADIVEKTEAESKKGKTLAPVDDETDSMVDIYPSYVNEFYSLIIDETTDWEQETGVDLADYGFIASGPIMYMELKRWKHAALLKDAWKASGIKAPVSFYETLDYLVDAMKANRAKPISYRHLQRSVTDLKSWNLERKRKTPSDRARPYFAIQDGAVYVIIDKNTTPAWSKLKNAVKVPGTKWVLEDGARWFISVKRTDLIAKVKQLIKDGVPIAELDWVKETISDFKNVTR